MDPKLKQKQDYLESSIDEFQQGIAAFLSHWILFQHQQLGIPPSQAPQEPIRWIKAYCDNILQQVEQQSTSTNKEED